MSGRDQFLYWVGYIIGVMLMIVMRIAMLKFFWWVCELEAWCGLPLPFEVALFAAVLMQTEHRPEK